MQQLNPPNFSDDGLDKARTVLELLDPATREQVLSRMSEEHRAKLTDPALMQRPLQDFSNSIAQKRRIMRQTVLRMGERTVREAETTQQSGQHGGMPSSAPAGSPAVQHRDALDQLRDVHPAALARAMQGERAEAWALVLHRLDDSARVALNAYLDPASRQAIESAQRLQSSLAPHLRDTIERALRNTIVPRALREHQALLSTPPSGS